MQISTKPMDLPEVTILYSPPGVGKTEMAAHYPKPLFLMIGLETGLLTLIKHGRVPADVAKIDTLLDTWLKLMEALDLVEQTGTQFSTLVLDTMNAAQYLLKAAVTEQEFENDPAQFDSYGKGWARMYEPWRMFLARLDAIRTRQHLRLVLLAHSQVNRIGNPDGEDYQSNAPELNEKWIWNQTNAWADNVLFANLEVVAVKKKGDSKAKAIKGDRRLLYVHSTASHFAKNRWGLREAVPMGTCGSDAYRNLSNAITAIRGGKPARKPAEKAQEATLQATWQKRFEAARNFTIAFGVFEDLGKAFLAAKEEEQIEVMPGIFKAFTARCLKLAAGNPEQLKLLSKSLHARQDLPLTAALELLPKEAA